MPVGTYVKTSKQRRLACEAKMTAEIKAGLYVNSDEVDAWIDSIGTGHELPSPPTRRH
jgi:predicted transcriptional regulator